ncbi:hypothetical protein CVT25_000575 [Psilocybe cyanescens]|uniref:Uncharacterized protein n=1 Tax=Psilocybe cyanescens TaxID=93625 RepID=A0A409WZZ1_PSICY|nr:hypothetical protein CVT25_000575 [Psilocybe cyanescens]
MDHTRSSKKPRLGQDADPAQSSRQEGRTTKATKASASTGPPWKRMTVGFIASDDYKPPTGTGINTVSLQAKLDVLNKEIKDTEWDSVVTFNEISTILYEATQEVTTMAKFKEENPGVTVSVCQNLQLSLDNLSANVPQQAISFSNVKEFHYSDLGIMILDSKVNSEQLLKDATEAFNLKGGQEYIDSIQKFCIEHKATVPRTIKNVITCSGERPEATGRLLIDQFILLIIDFLLENKETPLLFPELRLSSKEIPVIVKYETHATFISGTVDYALFAYSARVGPPIMYRWLINQLEAETTKIQLRTSSNLRQIGDHPIDDRDMETIKSMVMKDDMYLFLVEAKQKSYDSTLEKLIPQVAAEALAALGHLAWCLTTGTAWIFGVSKKAADVTMDLGYLKGATDTVWQERVEVLFRIILYWKSIPRLVPDDVHSMIKATTSPLRISAFMKAESI